MQNWPKSHKIIMVSITVGVILAIGTLMTLFMTVYNGAFQSVMVTGRTASSTPYQVHLAVHENPSKMVVAWSTLASTESVVYYGNQSGVYEKRANGTAHTYVATWDTYTSPYLHEVTLQDLAFETKYYYKVGDPGINEWSPEYSFMTGPASVADSDKVVRIVAYGDQGVSVEATSVIAKATTDSPHLTLVAGDLAYANGNSPVWDSYFNEIEPLSATAAFMVAPGNHEGFGGENFVSYLERFAMPGAKLWYSFNYGPVHIVAISTEHPLSTGTEQRMWLENDLALANMNRTEVPWILVFGHKPAYNSNSNYGSNLVIREDLEALFIANSVDIGLFGHEHSYERTYPLQSSAPVSSTKGRADSPYMELVEAPIWSVIGVGGAGLRHNFQIPQPEWSAHRESTENGYVLLTINGGKSLHWEYKRIDDAISDEFFICKVPPCTFHADLTIDGNYVYEPVAATLSGGAIAGIVIGCVVFVGLTVFIVLAIAFKWHKKYLKLNV